MKNISVTILSSLLLMGLLPLSLSARTWTSSEDESKTFSGKLKRYNNISKTVTIIRSNGRSTTFPIDKLSEADQKWVIETEAAKAAEAEKKAAPADIEEALEAQPIAQNIYKRLTQLNKGKLKKAEFQFVPEYYLLYFSASW